MYAINVGCLLYFVARYYDIPATSLQDHIYGRSSGRKCGRQGVQFVQEESDLVQYMLKM
jgi:hypothetical protein